MSGDKNGMLGVGGRRRRSTIPYSILMKVFELRCLLMNDDKNDCESINIGLQCDAGPCLLHV